MNSIINIRDDCKMNLKDVSGKKKLIISIVTILVIVIIVVIVMVLDYSNSNPKPLNVSMPVNNNVANNLSNTNPITITGTSNNNVSNESKDNANNTIQNSVPNENVVNNNISNSTNSVSNTTNNTTNSTVENPSSVDNSSSNQNSVNSSVSDLDIIVKNKNKVQIELKSGELSLTGATIIIVDKNITPYVWGPGYKLQIKQDGVWKDMEPLREMNFEDISYELNEEGIYEETINWLEDYGSLGQGNYRIVKSTNYNETNIEFYAEFLVNS